MLAAILRQCTSGRDTQLGGEVLNEDGHQIRPQQYPEQLVTEACSAGKIGGKIPRIDIGDAGHKGRPEPIQRLPGLQIGKQRRRRRKRKRGRRSRRHGTILDFSCCELSIACISVFLLTIVNDSSQSAPAAVVLPQFPTTGIGSIKEGLARADESAGNWCGW